MSINRLTFKVPKTAYINVLDYESIDDLAKYLLHLNSNKVAYNSYFKWKENLTANTNKKVTMFVPFCDMCIYMNLERFYGFKHKVLPRVEEFYSRKEKCKLASIVMKDNKMSYTLKNYSSFFIL